MLTQNDLDIMPPDTMFATGSAKDTPQELHLAGTGKLLRWVAQRGGIADWAIYAHFYEHDAEWVQRHGDKVRTEDFIRELVPCTDEAFKSYRH